MEEPIKMQLYQAAPPKGNSLFNVKMVLRVLGILLLIETMMFLSCAAVSWFYDEKEIRAFLISAGWNAAVAGILLFASKGASRQLSRRDGYCIASFTWILFTLFGMLPFYLSGSVANITDAFFETMSGFTTTGASIMDNIDSQSNGILFWRALTHWIGGLGIVCFAIALLPMVSDGNVQLFSAESIGVGTNKIHPKISITVKWIWFIYIILTATETILLYIGGMGWFDAICQSFSTTATGGFSTKQASIAYWDSSFIEYVIAIFMLLSAINFSLYFLCLKGQYKRVFRDEELRWFLGSVGILTLFITVSLVFQSGYDVYTAFRRAFFQVASLHSSTGFSTEDFMNWPSFTWILLIYAMLAGGCTSSTGGGIKNIRLVMVAKAIHNNFKRLLHPNAVLPVRVNKQTITSNVMVMVGAFIAFYIFCILVGWAVLLFLGVGFMEAFSTSVACMGNAGIGLGQCGPAFSWSALPDAAKWVLSFLMLIGRLEMFCVLLLFYRSFWKRV